MDAPYICWCPPLSHGRTELASSRGTLAPMLPKFPFISENKSTNFGRHLKTHKSTSVFELSAQLSALPTKLIMLQISNSKFDGMLSRYEKTTNTPCESRLVAFRSSSTSRTIYGRRASLPQAAPKALTWQAQALAATTWFSSLKKVYITSSIFAKVCFSFLNFKNGQNTSLDF